MSDFVKLRDKFERVGARFRHFQDVPTLRRGRVRSFRLGIGRDRRGEFFELVLGDEPAEFKVLSVKPHMRLLLLAVTRDGKTDKFLCGFDERHLFIAGVDSRVSNVPAAVDSLKPEPVLEALVRCRVKTRDRNRRRNAAFKRQGEWFFVPAPDLNPDCLRIYRKEPIRRGRGTAHIVEEAYREGGVTVYVSDAFPNGLTESEYIVAIQRDGELEKLNWQIMQREMTAYGRGSVRHPDHRTIVLDSWHQILVNAEVIEQRNALGELETVAFLD
jgi:hypothetical protein